jgi:pilus assembly protein Flp/PilA
MCGQAKGESCRTTSGWWTCIYELNADTESSCGVSLAGDGDSGTSVALGGAVVVPRRAVVARQHRSRVRDTTRGRNIMLSLLTRLRALSRDDRGQDLIEYALVAGLIALGSVALMGDVSGAINTVWSNIVSTLEGI